MKKITINTLVKNEENWIWYSLNSVLDLADEILVWDTGSTDNTVRIIKSIKSPKIKFRQFKNVTPESFTRLRQKMLEESIGGWIILVDGDEIWRDETVTQTKQIIRQSGDEYDYLVHCYRNLVGDVLHHQPENAGRYHIHEFSGHVTIRAFNKKRIHSVHFELPYGSEGIFNSSGKPIQNCNMSHAYVSEPYLHATHLARSSRDCDTLMRNNKFKYELGVRFPIEFKYPQCFYDPHPGIVPSVWKKRSLSYFLHSSWQTPLKLIRRHLVL
jgi:glycosyltransferase involved in cell wall biosynthesis